MIPEAILLRNEYFIWLSSWLVLFIVIIEQRKMNEAHKYYGKSAKNTHTHHHKRSLIDWLGGDQKRYHQKFVLYVCACWWAVDEAKYINKKKKKRNTKAIYQLLMVVLLLAFLLIHTQLFFNFFFIPYIVYLQTVDWKSLTL